MKKLMLWCSPEHAPPPGYLTVYWSQYIPDQERKAGNISLPEVVNDNVKYWKPRYLSWLESIGKSPCGTTTVVDALLIRPGLSYWWMTVPSDYSFSTSSIAYATIRLWSLAQIADDQHVEELEVHDADAELEEVLKIWCNRNGRRITFVRGHNINKNESQVQSTSSHMQRRIPPLIIGASFIALQYFRYLTWRRFKLSYDTVDEHSINVIDYFANLDTQAAREATFKSNYWGPLSQILSLLGKTVNWVHIDVRSPGLPSVQSAREAIRGLNRDNSSSSHVLLQDHLTLRIAFKATLQYVRIRRITKKVKAQIHWTETMSGLDVSPLVRSQLRSELQGLGAARNALWLSLFEEVFPFRSAQSLCIYLMENQPWELAFLQVRMAQGGGQNIGVAHVPVRSWDFRYALGSSSDGAQNGRTLPMPSYFTVIDPKSEAVMIENGLEPSTIVRVEALRFLSESSTVQGASKKRTAAFPCQRVLVFGEYDPLMFAKQLQVLEELIPLTGGKCSFIFRPHPAKPLLQETLPNGVSLSEEHTAGKALAECDVALCSNISSASLDANLRGIPILLFRDGRAFNGSPLIAQPGIKYVNDATEVAAALADLNFDGSPIFMARTYSMYLDSGLPKWRTLLGSP
jgi:surface carbohydrate biosynthesis protein (TIGR04326 family)